MKKAVLGIALLILTGTAFATVVEMEDATANNVLEVYEEMREEQEDVGTDNQWIHDFEKDSVGSEMDHMSTLKRTAENQEEM